MSTIALITAEEFALLNFAKDEDYELVEGELVRLSSATPRHKRVRDLLVTLLWSYFQRNPIGASYSEVDCRLNLVRFAGRTSLFFSILARER